MLFPTNGLDYDKVICDHYIVENTVLTCTNFPLCKIIWVKRLSISGDLKRFMSQVSLSSLYYNNSFKFPEILNILNCTLGIFDGVCHSCSLFAIIYATV